MTDSPNDLPPLWFRMAILAVLTALLAVNVYADIATSYDGQYVTLGLLGVIAAGIGLAKGLRGGDK